MRGRRTLLATVLAVGPILFIPPAAQSGVSHRMVDECIQLALATISTEANATRGELELLSWRVLEGEFDDYLVLTVSLPGPYEKVVDFVTDCDDGRVWRSSNFREPLPHPWNKLSRALREIVRAGGVPPFLEIVVFINLIEPMLSGSTIYVPGALDARIWAELTSQERAILEDYWNRSGIHSPEEHQRVIERAQRLINEYNRRISRPLLDSLFEKLSAMPGVNATEPTIWNFVSIGANVSRAAFFALWLDPNMGSMGLNTPSGLPRPPTEPAAVGPDSLTVLIGWFVVSTVLALLVLTLISRVGKTKL